MLMMVVALVFVGGLTAAVVGHINKKHRIENNKNIQNARREIMMRNIKKKKDDLSE